jgi:hypothetical protein
MKQGAIERLLGFRWPNGHILRLIWPDSKHALAKPTSPPPPGHER